MTDELGPELTGWKLPLGVGGIVIEQKPLVRLRQVSHAPSWATLSCLVCGTHDVFSVLFDDHRTRLDHPDWDTLLIPESNNIIVHKGLKDAAEIDALKQQSNYSRTFQLVMRPEEHLQTASSSDHPEFSKLRDELQLIFTKAIKLEEEKTRERIEAYKKQQEEDLATFRKNAESELQRLENMISQSLQTPKPELGPQEENVMNTIQEDSAELSDAMAVSGTLKKSTGRQRVRFDESSQNVTPSKLKESQEHISNLGKAPEDHRANVEEDGEVEENEESEDEENMFELDEELEPHGSHTVDEENENDDLDKESGERDNVETDDSHVIKAYSLPASSPLLMKARRRSSQKYPAGDTWDEHQDKDEDDGGKQEELTMYATSLPISINRIGAKQTPDVKNSAQPAKDQDAAIDSNNNKTFRFGTYDPSQRDLAASAQFQSSHPLNQRNSSAIRLLSRSFTDERSKHNHDNDDDDSGPMIPPHILAAQTFIDETEELFGPVPDTDR